MIETIYIPTYGRTNRQETYQNLPDHWKKRTVLVIHESEKEAFDKLGYPNIVCPHQGPPPDGENFNDYGLPRTKQWIIENAGPVKFLIIDDDISDFVYTARPSERNQYRLVNTCIGLTRLEPGFEDYFDKMMAEMSDWLDDYVTCGLEVTWNPPFEEDDKVCWRQTTNHFINGATYPTDKIDHTSILCVEDYYILLQLLTMGYPNRVNLRYRVRPGLTQADGGCEEYRTLEKHNKSMQQLHDAFPDFVTLKTKIAKNGKWGKVEKLAATIQWKKAYKSSQKNEEVSTADYNLEELFE